MIFKLIIDRFLLIFTIILISGCANIQLTIDQIEDKNLSSIEKNVIRGRLALRIAGEGLEPDAPPRHFSGSFELSGTPQSGELTLLTPLGTVAAQLNWQPLVANLVSDGKTRSFVNLADMLRQVTGAELPIDGLFAWLDGKPLQVPGWTVDLQRHAEGRVQARRETPAPALDLRMVIER